jgi:hypothetical protein
MFRWLVVTVALSVAAVVVGVLAAGLPAVERVQNVVSPNRMFKGPDQQPRDPVPHNLLADRNLLADMGDEPIDDQLPVSVVPRVVVDRCLLAPYDMQEVPSPHDGQLLFLGTSLLPGEQAAPEDLINEDVGVLAIP